MMYSTSREPAPHLAHRDRYLGLEDALGAPRAWVYSFRSSFAARRRPELLRPRRRGRWLARWRRTQYSVPSFVPYGAPNAWSTWLPKMVPWVPCGEVGWFRLISCFLARKDVQSGPEVGVRVEGGACGVSMLPHGDPGGAGRGYCGWWGLKMDHDGPVPKGILG